MYRANISTRMFQGGLAVSNFRDKSTRTRFSFASAASLLGLTPHDFDESKSPGLPRRDRARDRQHDLVSHRGHRDSRRHLHRRRPRVPAGGRRVGGAGIQGRRAAAKAVPSSICSATATIPRSPWPTCLHLQKTFGSLDDLRGKKIAMTWAYSPSYGKPLSVPQGIITLMTRFGMNVTLAHPEGYDLLPEATKRRRRHAKESGGSFAKVHSMEEAFKDADIVYPKSWAPFEVMKERTRLLRAGETAKVAGHREGGAGDQREVQELGVHREADEGHQGRQGPLHALPARGHHRRELQGGRGRGERLRPLQRARRTTRRSTSSTSSPR